MKDEIKNTAASAADEAKAGYKHPPAKSRFPKGKSGNPFGRRKGQRNLATVLKEVLQQTVRVKQGDRSERLTKGEALIKVILSKANNGDRRAIKGVSDLAEKIGRLDDINSETSSRGGIMLIPGVITSEEEWKKAMTEKVKWQEAKDQRLKEDARTLRKCVAGWEAHIIEHKGTPLGDFAVAQLAKLKNSDRYLTNYFLHWYPPEEEIEVDPPKKEEPPAKLPFDGDEYARTRTHARKEYERTHEQKVREPEAQPETALTPCYHRVKNRNIWSSVPWSELPPDDPRLRDEMPEGGCH
jgi:hypothetical protein